MLTAIVLPPTGETITAIRGGRRLRQRRGAARVSQDRARRGHPEHWPGPTGEDAETHARIGRAVTAMLGAALLVRMSVPATLELVEVAAGRLDGFWQHSQVRSGLSAGALLVEEAGGVVTDTHGRPWTFASEDFLAAAPACMRRPSPP